MHVGLNCRVWLCITCLYVICYDQLYTCVFYACAVVHVFEYGETLHTYNMYCRLLSNDVASYKLPHLTFWMSTCLTQLCPVLLTFGSKYTRVQIFTHWAHAPCGTEYNSYFPIQGGCSSKRLTISFLDDKIEKWNWLFLLSQVHFQAWNQENIQYKRVYRTISWYMYSTCVLC